LESLVNPPIQLVPAIPSARNSGSRFRFRPDFLFIALTFLWFGFLQTGRAQNFNPAAGKFALSNTTSGDAKPASSYQALFSNIGGDNNTATSAFALQINTGGNGNTATGEGALFNNTTAGNGWLELLLPPLLESRQ
jgi:hypothetical protein